MNFKVSVIIPVYNAALFLRKAVESALSHEEVGEVILVEDGSPDDSLKVCFELEKNYSKVKLYQHPDKKNHGAGASRNLGIRKSYYDFISFLDADDFYLQNRFRKDKEIFCKGQDIDGVYGGTGNFFYSDTARTVLRKAAGASFQYQEFISFDNAIPPEELIFALIGQHPNTRGHFSTDAITVRKSVFDKVGYFKEDLRLQQDVHLWIRLAAKCKLVPGLIKEPVAIRGVHGQQRMTDEDAQKKYTKERWDDLYSWFKKAGVSKPVFKAFQKSYFQFLIKSAPRKSKVILILLNSLLINPGYLSEPYSLFDLTILDLCGRKRYILFALSSKNRMVSVANQFRRFPS